MVFTRSPWTLGFVLASVVGTWGTGEAFADESVDKKKAQELFMAGRAALDKGDKVQGCALMRQSRDLFAVANALFNIAICDEDDGKIASALMHWERGLALVDSNDARAAAAKEHITKLSPRVPRLRIVLPTDEQVSAVLVDGKPLASGALSEPLKVEPGKHTIVVQSPGRQDRQHEMTLAEGERTEFVATPSAVKSGSSGTSGETPPAGPASNNQRTAGIVVAGLGAVGLIAAGATGVGVISTDGDIDAIDDSCLHRGECELATRAPLVSRYRTLVWVNTAAWGIGIAGAAAGLIMILTAPAKTEKPASTVAVAPVFVPGGASLNVFGRF